MRTRANFTGYYNNKGKTDFSPAAETKFFKHYTSFVAMFRMTIEPLLSSHFLGNVNI